MAVALFVAGSADAQSLKTGKKTPAPSKERCAAFEAQGRSALSSNRNSPKFKSANWNYQNGRKLCASGDYKSGIASLKQALDNLKVKFKD